MPRPLRIQHTDAAGSQESSSQNNFATLFAEVGLFLTVNNLLRGPELVSLVELIVSSEQEHILEQLFTSKSPVARSFSCRILEAISESAASSRFSCCKLLRHILACGLDSTIIAGPIGGRCLQLAISNSAQEFALLLLEKGVQRNTKLGTHPPFDQTPISLALSYGQHAVYRVLLDRGNTPEQERYARLRRACENVDLRQIRDLLHGGVDIDVDQWISQPDQRGSLLDYTFFWRRECYSVLLPHSQFAKHFWTASGITSAADEGPQALDAYLNSRRCPEKRTILTVLLDSLSTDLRNEITDRSRRILTLQQLARWPRLGLISAAMMAVALGLDWISRFKVVEHIKGKILGAALMSVNRELPMTLTDSSSIVSVEDAFHALIGLMLDSTSFDELGALKCLIEQGLNPNRPLYYRGHLYQPLCLVIWSANKPDSVNLVKYLVSIGARTSGMPPGTLTTPLGTAVLRRNPEIIQYLLEEGADVMEFAHRKGTTLLELLTQNHSFPEERAICKSLLVAGADLDGPVSRSPDMDWNTALTRAVIYDASDELAANLINLGANIQQIGGGSGARTPLQAAAEYGKFEIANVLLQRGALVNAFAAPDNGMTALQAACKGGTPSKRMMMLLLHAGADVNAAPSARYGRTALQALCSNDKTSSELMIMLVDRGAHINAPPAEYGGITALQGAAIAGNIKIVMLLIDMGADINAPPSKNEGRMALDGAAEHGHLDTVQLLLNFGATCMEPGASGHDSAIKFAEENGHFVIADLLRDWQGRPLDQPWDPEQGLRATYV